MAISPMDAFLLDHYTASHRSVWDASARSPLLRYRIAIHELTVAAGMEAVHADSMVAMPMDVAAHIGPDDNTRALTAGSVLRHNVPVLRIIGDWFRDGRAVGRA